MLSVVRFEMFSSRCPARELNIEKYSSYHEKQELKLHSLEKIILTGIANG